MDKTSSSSFYAVGRGFKTGIFNTWAECEANVKGFSGAKFKKFASESEALAFVAQWAQNQHAGSSQSLVGSNNLAMGTGTRKGNDSNKTGGVRQFSTTLNTTSAKNDKINGINASSKRKHNQDIRRTQLLDTPPAKYNGSKRHRVDSPQVQKGVVSADGEQIYLPFIVDEDDFVNVYTDGACRGNGRSNPKAGVGVWFGDDHPLNISEPVDGPPTNNTAEIQAARRAIETATEAGFSKLKINTDSEFLINCATQWLPKWKLNGWKLANGGDVKNRIELEKLDRAQKNIVIYWNKVLAHSDIYGNEMADRLANEGAFK